MSVLRYIVRVTLRKQLELVVLVVIGTALGLAPIHLFRTVVDRVIPSRDSTLLWQLGALLVAMVIGRVIVNYRQAVVSEQIRQGFIGEIRGRLYAHVIRLSPEFFTKHAVGNLVHRVQLEVGRLGMSVAWILIEPLLHSVTVVVYLAYLVSMSASLSLLSLAGLPLVLLVAPRVNRKLASNERAFTGLIGAYIARMTEGFSGIYEVQAHATYEYEVGRLAAQQDRVTENRVSLARTAGWLDVLSDLTRGIGPILVYTYGATLAIAGRMTVGEIVAFTGTLGGLYAAIDKLVKYPPQLRNAQDRFDELSELWKIPPAFVDPPSGAVPISSRRVGDAVAITLDRVTFGYDSKEPLLNDLSLELAPGQHVVLVGRSGCGKSTVMGLLSGRLTPREGEVRLDERRLAAEPASVLARTIGTVGQHPFLFHTSLRANLLYALLRAPAAGDDPRAYADLSSLDLGAHTDDAAIDAKLVAACRDVGLEEELLEFGIEARLPAADAATLLAVRPTLAKRLADEPALVRFVPGARLPGENERDVYDPARWHPSISVRDNLLFGRIDADDAAARQRIHEALHDALDDAKQLERISRLGLDFEVGEKGTRLSGGQRQKVSIARVLLKRAPVLLLDEATASLDKRSATRVHDLFTERWRGRTLIAITHDLVLADRFDRVVVLDKGQVVEDGKPAELLARDGLFRELYEAATSNSEA